MKRVLVTGAAGFLGRHSLAHLVRRGYEVRAVRFQSTVESMPGVVWHQGNLFSADDRRALMEQARPTHLLHFAWYAEPGKYWESSENVRWLQASLELFTAFAAQGGKRAVMAGTCAEYDWADGYCKEFVTPLAPKSLYGVCKHALHQIEETLAKQYGITSAWGRIFFLYGPGEHPRRLVSSVVSSLLDRRPAPCSHGRQIRDFLHVDDVASAFAAVLDSEMTGPVNIASGKPVAVMDVVKTIAAKLNAEDLLRLGEYPTPADEPPLLVADVTRLVTEIGWAPKFDLESGLDDTIAWWRRHLS
jgi:nucleoside-diphosphate-sugar epimerase